MTGKKHDLKSLVGIGGLLSVILFSLFWFSDQYFSSPYVPDEASAGLLDINSHPSSFGEPKLWSDPSIWPGNKVPDSTTDVTINADETIIVDTPALSRSVLVYGNLKLDSTLQTGGIKVIGGFVTTSMRGATLPKYLIVDLAAQDSLITTDCVRDNDIINNQVVGFGTLDSELLKKLNVCLPL